MRSWKLVGHLSPAPVQVRLASLLFVILVSIYNLYLMSEETGQGWGGSGVVLC